jgi:Protein of unknown function (DUF3237)
MIIRKLRILFASILAVAGVIGANSSMAQGPTTSIATEYIMSVRANVAAMRVTDGLSVIEVTSGSVDGPRIKGRLIPPGADWVRNLPGDIGRLDVRIMIRTEDDQLIYLAYNGVLKCSKEANTRLTNGEKLGADDGCYYMLAPTFETKSEKYKWLNEIQTVGKMIEFQRINDPHVAYDIFALR